MRRIRWVLLGVLLVALGGAGLGVGAFHLMEEAGRRARGPSGALADALLDGNASVLASFVPREEVARSQLEGSQLTLFLQNEFFDRYDVVHIDPLTKATESWRLDLRDREGHAVELWLPVRRQTGRIEVPYLMTRLALFNAQQDGHAWSEIAEIEETRFSLCYGSNYVATPSGVRRWRDLQTSTLASR